jgi:putative FmdB family regulatory protein
MPIYEFQCQECHKENEVLVRGQDWSLAICPDCGSKQLKKKLSVFSAASSEAELTPVCSGNPSACGRCDADG